MLTAADNDLLCRVEGDAPMGRLMRAHWIPACLSEEVAERDGAPRARSAFWAKSSSPSATPTAGSACWTSTARTAARRSRSAATRNAACAASTTAGRSTSTGNVVDRPSEAARQRAREQRLKHRDLSLPRGGRLRLGVDGRPGDARAISSRRRGRPRPTSAPASSRSHVDCNWAQVLEGAIDSAHSSSLHSTDMVPAQRRRRRRDRRASGCARRPTRRRGSPCSARASASATSRSAARSRAPIRTTTCGSRCSSRRSRC